MPSHLGRKCDGLCTPHYTNPHSSTTLIFHSLPFILTFAVISITVLHRLFPLLCGSSSRTTAAYSPPEVRTRKRLAALAFSTTLGATGVLAELILCEVSDWVDVEARRFAFRVTVETLLVCLIVVIPGIQIVSAVEGSRMGRWSSGKKWSVVVGAFVGWVWVFWNIGDVLPIRRKEGSLWTSSRTLSEECVARVGIVGISLMALLSGFSCVSTPFSSKPRPVSDTDITRAQGGFDSAQEMLITKRTQLSILTKRITEKQSTSADPGLLSKVFTSIRSLSDSDRAEQTLLETEISGLETMVSHYQSELSHLRSTQAAQLASRTPFGRLRSSAYFIFSLYCLYRIVATTFAHLPFIPHPYSTRQTSSPYSADPDASSDSSFSQTDPITNLLALLAKHYDPHLDRAAWSRQIGFLLSGVIIFCSLNSVLSTLSLFSRAAPEAVHQHLAKSPEGGRVGRALVVSQLSAVYVVAAALLLRSNLPEEMRGVISEALGAPLDTRWVERWFDGLFLGAVGLTGVGVVVVRKVRGLKGGWEGERAEEWELGGKEC